MAGPRRLRAIQVIPVDVEDWGHAVSDLSRKAIHGLRSAGIDPELVVALDLREVADGVLEIPCGVAGGPTIRHRWKIKDEPQPWPAKKRRGLWWPMGARGSTAIICLGAPCTLTLASLLFRVGHDGTIYRRPNLPAVLADAVPVCLPETRIGLAVEWLDDAGPDDLFTELVGGHPDRKVAFLALPKIDPPSALVESFVEAFIETGIACELVPALVLLPGGLTWGELLAPYPGAGKTFALAGVLDFWRHAALCMPFPSNEGDPP